MKNLVAIYQARYGLRPQVKLRGYQLQAIAVGIKNPSYALLMAPRLGKTRADIAVAGYRRINNGIKRWVIICPSIAKAVWADEIRDTLALPYHLEQVEGKGEERRLMIKEWVDQPGKLSIVIMNFEATWRIKKFLYKFKPDKITVDESHRIKNRAAKQSKTIQTLGTRASYRAILTGTLLSTPTDVFSQYKFLEPEIFGGNWAGFCDQYVDKWGFGGYKPKSFKNLDDLQDRITSVAFQLNREQAGGFPSEQYQTIEFPLTGPTAKAYKEMEKVLKTIVNDGTEVTATIVLTQVLRLQQITGGFVSHREPDDNQPTNHELGEDRIKALREILFDYPVSSPIVIFVRFRYELDKVLELCRKLGRTVNYIAGGLTRAEKDQAKYAFQEGHIDTCVVQIKAGGIAIDLSRARDAIFFSLTSSLIDYEQAKARIIARTGGRVSILHLVARDTVDGDVLESLTERKNLAEIILNKFHHTP